MSSINPQLEVLTRQVDRIVVYNKADLANPNMQTVRDVSARLRRRMASTEPNSGTGAFFCLSAGPQRVRDALRQYCDVPDPLFTNAADGRHIGPLLELAKRAASSGVQPRTRPEARTMLTTSGTLTLAPHAFAGCARIKRKAQVGLEADAVMMVVGMPNVGKSSLINALRRAGTGKGARASACAVRRAVVSSPTKSNTCPRVAASADGVQARRRQWGPRRASPRASWVQLKSWTSRALTSSTRRV